MKLIKCVIVAAITILLCGVAYSNSVDVAEPTDCMQEINAAIDDFKAGYKNRAIDQLISLKTSSCEEDKVLCSYYMSKLLFSMGRSREARTELSNILPELNTLPVCQQSFAIYLLLPKSQLTHLGYPKDIETLENDIVANGIELEPDVYSYLEARKAETELNYAEAAKLYRQVLDLTEMTLIHDDACLRLLINSLLSVNTIGDKSDLQKYIDHVFENMKRYRLSQLYKLKEALEKHCLLEYSKKVSSYLETKSLKMVTNENKEKIWKRTFEKGGAVYFIMPEIAKEIGEEEMRRYKEFTTMDPEEIYQNIKGMNKNESSKLAYYLGGFMQGYPAEFKTMMEISFPRRFEKYFIKGFIQEGPAYDAYSGTRGYILANVRKIRDPGIINALKEKSNSEGVDLQVKHLIQNYLKSIR